MEIGVFDAKNRLSELLDGVERGDEVVITRRGRPVARLVPAGGYDRKKAEAALDTMRERAKRIGLGEPSVRDLIDEGRM